MNVTNLSLGIMVNYELVYEDIFDSREFSDFLRRKKTTFVSS